MPLFIHIIVVLADIFIFTHHMGMAIEARWTGEYKKYGVHLAISIVALVFIIKFICFP